MHHVLVPSDFFRIESRGTATILRLTSPDGTNRLTRACIRALTAGIEELRQQSTPLIITGWGGTQRLPRLIGKGRALQLFITAEKISAAQALEIGLIDAIADDAVAEAIKLSN